MKNYLFLLPFFLITIACSSDPSQSAFPKQLPVDNRAEKQAAAQRDHEMEQRTAAIQQTLVQKEAIETGLSDGSISTYDVRDGDGAFIAESTTYYKDAEKKAPCKTKIIYLTGGSTDVYWLKSQFILVNKDTYEYLFKGAEFIAVFKDGTRVEVTDKELQEATKIPGIASKIIASPVPTTEG